MDSECPTPKLQPTLDDEATPSVEARDQTTATARSRRAPESAAEARGQRLAKDRAGESVSPLKQWRRRRGA